MEERRSEKYTVPPKAVASEFNISPRTVRRMCDRGDLKAMKVGKQWRIREDWRDHLKAKAGMN